MEQRYRTVLSPLESEVQEAAQDLDGRAPPVGMNNTPSCRSVPTGGCLKRVEKYPAQGSPDLLPVCRIAGRDRETIDAGHGKYLLPQGKNTALPRYRGHPRPEKTPSPATAGRRMASRISTARKITPAARRVTEPPEITPQMWNIPFPEQIPPLYRRSGLQRPGGAEPDPGGTRLPFCGRGGIELHLYATVWKKITIPTCSRMCSGADQRGGRNLL